MDKKNEELDYETVIDLIRARDVAHEELSRIDAMVTMLLNGEWAEHVGKGSHSRAVEGVFTKLINEVSRIGDERDQLQAELAALLVPRDLSHAAIDVLAERTRQVKQEGWSTDYDDQHSDGQMAVAAGYYALACGFPHDRDGRRAPPYWPWDESCWKPKDARSNLVRSAALILAEIERLDRRAQLAANQVDGGDENGRL